MIDARFEYKVVHCEEGNVDAWSPDGQYENAAAFERAFTETRRLRAEFIEAFLAEHAVEGWRLHTAIQRGGTCDPMLLIFEREAT